MNPLEACPENAEADRLRALQLRALMSTEGFIGCAVADVDSGALLVGESHERGVDLALAARVLAQSLRVQQHAAQAMGCHTPVEEIVLCAGTDQYVVRPLTARKHQFIFAKLHHAYANLTLARLRLAQAQGALA